MLPDVHTFRSAELHRVRHGPHALGVSSLDFKVICGIEGQFLDLMGEPVSHNRLNDPVMGHSLHISAVEDDVTCKACTHTRAHTRQITYISIVCCTTLN